MRVPIKPWESNFLHFQSYQSLSMYFTTYTSTELCNHSPVRQIVFVSVRDKKLNEGKNKRVESAITNCKPCFQPQQNLSGVTYLSTHAVVISKTMFFNDELGSIRKLEEGNLSFPPPREWSTFCTTTTQHHYHSLHPTADPYTPLWHCHPVSLLTQFLNCPTNPILHCLPATLPFCLIKPAYFTHNPCL